METLQAAAASRGLYLYHHPGNDGINCQFFAVEDQLAQCGVLPPGLNAITLKKRIFKWLNEHSGLLLDSEWRNPTTQRGELTTLSTFIPNFEEFISNEKREWGNHETLAAACTVLMEDYQLLVDCQVQKALAWALQSSTLTNVTSNGRC